MIDVDRRLVRVHAHPAVLGRPVVLVVAVLEGPCHLQLEAVEDLKRAMLKSEIKALETAIALAKEAGVTAARYAELGQAQGLLDSIKRDIEEQKAKKRKAELKNGRLAMIGIISFLVGHNLPGAVPALNSAF